MCNDYQLSTSSLNMASGDYLCQSHYVLGIPRLGNSPNFEQKYFPMVSKFQLESISQATVVRNLVIYGLHYDLPIWIQSHILFFQFGLLQGELEQRCHTVWLFWACILLYEINQLLPVHHICIRGLDLFGGKNHILAIRHPGNHNDEGCIWQLGDVTYRLLTCTVTQIHRWSLVGSPSISACLLNYVCKFL
jgi:hypothetical protein